MEIILMEKNVKGKGWVNLEAEIYDQRSDRSVLLQNQDINYIGRKLVNWIENALKRFHRWHFKMAKGEQEMNLGSMILELRSKNERGESNLWIK